MNKFFLVCLFLGAVLCNVQGQGIEFFHGTWKEAMEKAKAEDKIIFVDAFAKWCGPCKAMAKNVFTQEKVGEFFNSNFINLKLDMEEADGVSFGHQYPVSAYPTLFFLDGEGKVLSKVKGGQQPDGLISLGQNAMKNNDRSGKYEEKYLAGDRSFDLMYNYVKALNAVAKPSLKISNEYLNSSPKISEDERSKFVLEAAIEADSKLFDEVIKQKSKMTSLFGEELYTEKCKIACQNTANKAVEYEMESLLEETMTKAEKTFPKDAPAFNNKAAMKYYASAKNNQKYTSAYKNLAKISSKDTETLKFIAQDIFKNFKDDKKMVSDAVAYSEKVFDIKEDIESLQMYCMALIVNKENERAVKAVEKAIEKLKKEGKDTTQFTGLLNFVKSK